MAVFSRESGGIFHCQVELSECGDQSYKRAIKWIEGNQMCSRIDVEEQNLYEFIKSHTSGVCVFSVVGYTCFGAIIILKGGDGNDYELLDTFFNLAQGDKE
jgi:hypothetical protein